MNEHAKKLIDDWRWEAMTKTVGPTRITYAFTPEELEKYTEFVVRQCAKIADHEYDKGSRPVGCDILEYFGVE